MSRRIKIMLGGAAIAALLASGMIAAGAFNDVPPPPGVMEDGSVDISKIPLRIPVSNSDGEVVGYASRDALFGPPTDTPENPDPGRDPVPVTNEQGELVGHVVEEQGFVALP